MRKYQQNAEEKISNENNVEHERIELLSLVHYRLLHNIKQHIKPNYGNANQRQIE